MKQALFWWLWLVPSLVLANQGAEAVLQQLRLPPGFSISLFADNVPNARSLALAEEGVVFVGTRSGAVYAVQDKNQDGKADARFMIAQQLNVPNGVAYRDGTLYVAEVDKILRFNNILAKLDDPPEASVIYDQLPNDRHHGWKYLRFGPDGKLYTAVGAPCNICNPKQPIYATLVRLTVDGANLQVVARGVRNSVGFDWQPETNDLYFHDNGRDYLGDDIPPDELNRVSEIGAHYGYPFCHAGDIQDPKFGSGIDCSTYTAPVHRYGAHVAPLGMRFYRGQQFPVQYQQQLFVAQHGSWNRSEPQGYQVAVVSFKDSHTVTEQTFISGWLTASGEVLGRPVDILELPNGDLLISDDRLGVIYRVHYEAQF
ncbi:MAG: PQQ-dependent sugar dehydrogenase [Methylococcales bacterium]|nr:PQQ-dependent sugar dehydrogenase [Methylococcales bacterium]